MFISIAYIAGKHWQPTCTMPEQEQIALIAASFSFCRWLTLSVNASIAASPCTQSIAC